MGDKNGYNKFFLKFDKEGWLSRGDKVWDMWNACGWNGGRD